MRALRRFACFIVTLALLASLSAAAALAAGQSRYADVAEDSWAAEVIEKASSYGLMEGVGGGVFGYGRAMTRAEFVTVLTRMFGWSAAGVGDKASDIALSWARSYINAAGEHGVFDTGKAFRPESLITRAEMAEMLIRALGLGKCAAAAGSFALPFTDVTDNSGYIAAAYDIGMTNGMTETTFEPEGHATREQAAAMLVRVYDKLRGKTEWLHGFYAISSYDQIGLAEKMDAVTLGWSRMTCGDAGASLSTSSDGGNEYAAPDGYAGVVEKLKSAGVKLHLGVFMEGAELKKMLSDGTYRTQGAAAVMSELVRSYDALGYNPYSGVTVDFEGLSGETERTELTSFLKELSDGLAAAGKTLYVAVMPAAANGDYYDGYDYRAIGDMADKVILMAHDYAAASLKDYVGTEYYKNTALTPIGSVYYSLRAAVDADTGVRDKSKLALAISCDSIAWKTDGSGKLASETPLRPAYTTIYKRLAAGAAMGWSDAYGNPYLTYTTEDGQNIFLWYEDARSVALKTKLARLMGVTSVSVWRLGLIPNYSDAGLYYDVFGAMKG